MSGTKPFAISKQEVWKAYLHVKSNGGAAGVDAESIAAFEQNLKGNLYRLWNRMASGTYLPPPVREVTIPKLDGGERKLGIPTVTDRIDQTVVKQQLEPLVEPYFHRDSYGYRPQKSAVEAVGRARQRCWAYDWVVDLDIRAFFDTLDHHLVMRAVRRYTSCRWILLYVERWLTAPVQHEDGTLTARYAGTPQGGVVSRLRRLGLRLCRLWQGPRGTRRVRRARPSLPVGPTPRASSCRGGGVLLLLRAHRASRRVARRALVGTMPACLVTEGAELVDGDRGEYPNTPFEGLICQPPKFPA